MSLSIALLTYSTKPRGSVIHTLELAQSLIDLGHSPHVFALDKDNQGFHRPTPFLTYPVPAAPCHQGIDQLIQQRITEFVHFFQHHPHKYDIYHAQDCLSANALAILKQQGHIPHFVRTVHHIEDFQSPYLQACQEKSIHQPDRCLCVSNIWQQVLAKDYGINAHRVINGVSGRFSPQPDGTEGLLAQAYGLQDGPIYLTVGGIEPRKNSINLLKAFHRVRQQQPQAQLMIAGGATLFDYQPYRQKFMQLVEAYDLAKGLILPGVVPDAELPALYRLADGFVFPSIQEGWGLVVLEAIASGLPVLTSNQAPFTEFLSDKEAMLVDPGDVDAISTAMVSLLTPAIAQPLIQNSRSIIHRYSWQQSAQMHLELYHQLTPDPTTPNSLRT
ncbi:MSMEG_0565 family glycosyltransferase [Leptothoe sp. PORK10 BA2]|uniref:MSMEG_0565 family glycosyltransferase n=1 Tax=Leptothoe sp. PORK10 BA2 TaxID=3110254 RepID=UPI002B21E1A8|nr:MSMEG_0565 family glycosyltransferase [Leptothoe sp. PORK10 BA2]MEA5466442.1 MSMEG_0565 family glycosyltransferase [Leptothoe sp. PORK10 BA2]